MTNSICEGPRNMLPEEYDEVMDLIVKSYGDTKQHCLNYFPQHKRENFTFDDHFVIKKDGNLVSHVGLYPMEAIAGSLKVRIGAIGDVATHPEYRRKGYMGKLMDYSVEKMKERKIPLSLLWGDTQRYRYYGWETSGRKMSFHLTKHSVKEIEAGKEFTLRGYDGKKDLDTIMELHEREPARIKRSQTDYERLLQRTQIQIWMGNEGNSWAYAVLNNKHVIEFGGEPSTVAKLFSFILNNYPVGSLDLSFPYKDGEMLHVLYKISCSWEIEPLGMIKIIDLVETLLSFKKDLEDKARLHRIEKGNSLTLKMRDTDQEASLFAGDGIEIRETGSQNTVSLSDIEMVRLLFSSSPESFAEDSKQKRLLSSFFPLDFYVWGLDHV